MNFKNNKSMMGLCAAAAVFTAGCTSFTPVVRENYQIGVNKAGIYEEIFNSDSLKYGGSGVTNGSNIQSGDGWNFKPYGITVNLPPLSVTVYRLKEQM